MLEGMTSVGYDRDNGADVVPASVAFCADDYRETFDRLDGVCWVVLMPSDMEGCGLMNAAYESVSLASVRVARSHGLCSLAAHSSGAGSPSLVHERKHRALADSSSV
jgi:hypothetical protein